jgi:hypothetical protein
MTSRTILVATTAAALATAAFAEGYDAPVSTPIEFRFHVDDGLAEQDVFVEGTEAETVTRATAADRDMGAALYSAAVRVPHNPFDESTNGPWPKGEPLGITLGQWFAAEGSGSYTCENGEGRLEVAFDGLVPEGVYTMWHYFMAWPPTDPFIGTYDLPLGSRDGAQSVFQADAEGRASFDRTFHPCLQLTGEHLASGLAIAWHSDGQTYGVEPGEFGKDSHVQLYTGLPQRAGM